MPGGPCKQRRESSSDRNKQEELNGALRPPIRANVIEVHGVELGGQQYAVKPQVVRQNQESALCREPDRHIRQPNRSKTIVTCRCLAFDEFLMENFDLHCEFSKARFAGRFAELHNKLLVSVITFGVATHFANRDTRTCRR